MEDKVFVNADLKDVRISNILDNKEEYEKNETSGEIINYFSNKTNKEQNDVLINEINEEKEKKRKI